ncbi:hypothetical protein NESM_000513200 [Novymonas esmeraldas]|uniref:Uncharacterized protein n=1 Tax=Novymonas esmeraldas TaxID=1808958 RepID=A0AAW0ERK0_9TRYP
MPAEQVKKLHARRSFLEPLRTPKLPKSSHAAGAVPASATKSVTPTSTYEWLQLASHLLIAGDGNNEAEERVLSVCEEAAAMLLEDDAKSRAAAAASKAPTAAEAEAAAFSPREGDDTGDGGAEGDPSRGDDDPAAADGHAPSTERLQAAYLLTAAAVAAAEAHRLPAIEAGVRIARAAVEAYRCPMTACALATACMRWAASARDGGSRTAAQQTALAVIAATHSDLLSSDAPPEEEAGYVLRMTWLLAGAGAVDEARAPLTAVLRQNPKSYMGLLLLALLHAAEGDYDRARDAAVHLLEAYPDDVVGVVVHAAVRCRCRLPDAVDAQGKDATASVSGTGGGGSSEEAAEALAVAMARIASLDAAATSATSAGVKKKSLKGLCTHCAPDEDVEGGPKHSAAELRRRVVGHWALLSHVAGRLGCTTMAEVAADAGIDAVTQSRLLYRRSFADLQCSQARLALTRLRESIVAHRVHHVRGPTAVLVRDVNLLGTFDFDAVSACDPHRMVAGLPLSSGVAGGVRGASSLLADTAAQRLLPPGVFDSVASTLLAAVEVYPNHAEAHALLGVARLLEASQSDLPSDTRHNRLQEAGRHFMDAVRADGELTEAYLGAGVVAEAQGAMNESFDFYTSAAEVSARAPLIPWQYFDYLYQ